MTKAAAGHRGGFLLSAARRKCGDRTARPPQQIHLTFS
jgi:hypothetical protein